ncbi:transporter substrate-binding domain-containing protein [Bosea sp. 685]|uniref:transporter substrate-binding domain-containing protein n=1 Tax=Bosea sp. 685 TaxID=3080057 RepID=UPI002893684A|nr:transporter substrate-binding domain-containing protein [Bosea sp. 685]WNJ90096.1 transporter substrate-binding domain-containing protein [Bosea sp. 685]
MKITRSSFLTLGLGAAAGLVFGTAPRSASAKEWKVIRVATEGAFPPYNMHAPDGRLIGFEPELLQELSTRMNVKCEMIAQAWDGIIAGLTDGKYDAIMDGLSITPKREEVIAFSRPYASAGSGFAIMKEGSIKTLPGTGTRVPLTDEAAAKQAIDELAKLLAGKTIGVQVATIQNDVLTKYLKDVVTIRTYPSGPDTFLDLKAGRVDAVMASAINLNASAKKSNGEMIQSGYLFSGGLLGLGSAVGLRKSDPDLKEMFDKALKSVAEDGTLKRLSLKWFEMDITPII